MIDENECTAVKLPPSLYDSIEKKVVSLYKECGISSAPIDPFDIASRRGYIVKPFSSFNREAQSDFLKLDLDGANCYDPDRETFVICYDDSKGRERIRFTLMHEIGHIDMGHREESELARKAADYYAAYALAPSPIIGLKECEDCMDVARVFKVSQTCADICYQRFVNWKRIPAELKPYERALLGLFRKNKTTQRM